MQAINSAVMKKQNRGMVLDWIRKGPVSRAELSNRTQLTRASITQIIDKLICEGLVCETDLVESGRPGRKQTLLALVEDALYMAGISLDSKKYHLSLINLCGKVLLSGEGVVQDRPAEEVLAEIAGRLKAAVAELGLDSKKVFGVGVSAPGPLNKAEGIILNPPAFRAWHNVPVAQLLNRHLDWQVYLGNISNAFALDELYFGIGSQVENFMVLHVTDNVGAGFVLNGRLLLGPQDSQTEIGHTSIDRYGPLCECGNRGCLEKYISMPSVLRKTAYLSWKQLVDNLQSDPVAEAVFAREAEDLAFGIVNLLNVFGLDKVVIKGDLDYGGERFSAMVNSWIQGRSLRLPPGDIVIPGGPTNIARIAAMPAYRKLFTLR